MSAKAAPAGVTRQAVLDYLIREADLDGLVTVAYREVGEVLGVDKSDVGRHVRNLAAEGLLTIVPNGAGYLNMNAIQLGEAVFA